MMLNNSEAIMIRRSRGFAPLPIQLEKSSASGVLAIGGELKNAFCIARDNMAYLAPHIGDMEDVRSQEALAESIKLFSSMLECSPQLVVCDMHPGYHTTAMAEKMGLPLVKIQHHYAHILSCMAENNCQQQVIGIALDGTGYGQDGTIWGGEILLADPDNFVRAGHIASFPLPGGDAAAREGWRGAVGMLVKYAPERAEKYAAQFELCSPNEFKMISAMTKNRINTVECSSAGRLFDAVSALLKISRTSTFEGDAAMRLQFAAEAWLKEHTSEARSIKADSLASSDGILATEKLFIYLAELLEQGRSAGYCAYIFHLALSEMLVNAALELREKSQVNICALSGGSFQNRLLLNLCVEKLESNGFEVLTHKMVPANDGGISLGQAFYGINYINNHK
jgi:hydrogenase maturation protein HypF